MTFNIIFGLLAGFALWELSYFFYYVHKGKALSKNGHLKKAELGKGRDFRLLIAGDSIGTGMGASSFEKSVAGRIANHFASNMHVLMHNISFNGNRVKNLLQNEVRGKYDLCVVFISSNDVIRFTSIREFEKDAIKMLEKYSKIAKKLVIIGPGNVGKAFVFPAFLRIIYLKTALKYAGILKKSASKFKNVSYINSIYPNKKLGKYIREYYGTDMFHPNDEGHKFWFEIAKEHL